MIQARTSLPSVNTGFLKICQKLFHTYSLPYVSQDCQFFFFFTFFTNVAINNKRNILNFGHIIEAITKNRTWKFLIYKKIQASPPVLCKELSFLFYCDDNSPSLPPVIFISFCLYFKRMCICSRSAHFERTIKGTDIDISRKTISNTFVGQGNQIRR